MSELERRLAEGEVILLDGGMGTELQRRGVPMDRVAWSGAAVITHPEVIRAVHEDYLRAGAEVIITNTFGTARHVLEPAGLGERVVEINRTAIALAREARENAGRPSWIAGSLSSFLPENAKDKPIPPEVARANYREQAGLLAEAGADLLVLEMMIDVEYSRYAVEAAKATGLPVWVGFSLRPGRDGTLVSWRHEAGETPFAEMLEPVLAAGGSLVGVMHSEVETVEPALEVIRGHWRGPVAAYPHSGHFVMPNWQFVDIIAPEDHLAHARRWVEAGAQVIGGCCGIGPAHTKLLREGLPRRVARRNG